MRSRPLRRLFRRRLFSLASFQRTASVLTISTTLTALCVGALPVSAQPSAPVATPVATAPTKLLVDLLEKTDVVWRDGYPTQLTLADVPKAVERLQIAEIRSSRPAFSWVVPAPKRGAAQSAWRIQIATDRSILAESKGAPDVWDSGKTPGAESTAVPFGASEPLKPSTVYYWRVKTWDETDAPSDWSAIKAFQTAATLDESGASRYPLVKKVDRPQSAAPLDARTTFYDFGRASFGQIRVEIDSKAAGRVALVRVGERIKDGRVDRKPAGSTRYWEYRLPLQTGRQFYSIKTRVDKRNSSGAAVLMPDYVGEVMPFRYAEVEILPASPVKTDNTDKTAATETAEPAQVGSLFDAAPEPIVLSVVRETVTYPFDVSASYFDCDDDRLNRVW
ncbi:MAG: family 78 glycoside hydrolase catalytic domain, partial [Thermoguttaceae bacterium]|nr:family 78 glycoside hydrolase catalytic domain [Thermoguttaceae bacterium]